MSNILKYLCFVLFGIIIYLLLIKETLYEGYGGECPERDSVDWSTANNCLEQPMIIDYHDQGECGTCGIYALTSLIECYYNIEITKQNRDDLSKVSISPQSIIDIIGRYIHLYHTLYQLHGAQAGVSAESLHGAVPLTDDNLREPIYNNYHNYDMDDYSVTSCQMCEKSNNENCATVSGCGMWWYPKSSTRLLFYILKDMKDIEDKVGKIILSVRREKERDLTDLKSRMRSQNFKFPFPFLKKNAVRKDGRGYNDNNRTCIFITLFNEDLHTLKAENYLYTDKFTPNSFVDLGLHNIVPIFGPRLVVGLGLPEFKNTIKRNLRNGPLLVSIHVDPEHSLNSEGIINIFNLRWDLYRDFPNHSCLLIGFEGDNLILLNTWPPHPEDGEIGVQHYITNDITFKDLLDNVLLSARSEMEADDLYFGVQLWHIEINIDPIPPPPPPPPDWLGLIGVGGATTAVIGAMAACAARRRRYAELDISEEVGGSHHP